MSLKFDSRNFNSVVLIFYPGIYQKLSYTIFNSKKFWFQYLLKSTTSPIDYRVVLLKGYKKR